jgi:acetyltransferase-like isoleucine patch superfamily enzyme
MSLINTIKSSPGLKKFVHRLLIPQGQARPRLWVRMFVSPFIHKKGKGSSIRFSARLDVFPFNKFSLGANSIIEDFSTINNGVGDVYIGDHSRIGLSSVIIGPVTVGDYVILAQNVVVSGLNHSYEDVTVPPRLQKVITKPINIGDNVWIGANAVVTAGITIGKHSVVGAGSVVTRDIPEYCVAVGNPARIIKTYDFEANKWVKT